MQVETFECVETASEPIEASEEAIAIIESMGLEGQKSLVKPKETTQFAGRCPYRQITAEEMFVYGVLCPEQSRLKDYKATPIPLRVLQIASHAESLGMFKRLEVWDRESVSIKDPVLVAWTRDKYEWNGQQCFILARWGEELETFATLLKRACGAMREKLQVQASQIVARLPGMTDAEIVKLGADKVLSLEA